MRLRKSQKIYLCILQIMVPAENRRNYSLLYHQYHLSDLPTFVSEVNDSELHISYRFKLAEVNP